jgi:hypothetical protein
MRKKSSQASYKRHESKGKISAKERIIASSMYWMHKALDHKYCIWNGRNEGKKTSSDIYKKYPTYLFELFIGLLYCKVEVDPSRNNCKGKEPLHLFIYLMNKTLN